MIVLVPLVPLVPLALLAFLTTVRAQCQSSNSLSWSYPPKFIDGIHGTVIYNGLNTPRGLRYDGTGHLLVVETSKGVVALLENSDGCSGWTKRVVVEDGSLNHGIAVNGTALYASAPEYVYSWTYDPQALTAFNKQTIVNIPSGNSSTGHKTRSLELQPAEGSSPQYLIISAGSLSNLEASAIDPNFGTAQIRRFALNNIPSGGYNWTDGELVAWGMRNAVGIALTSDGSKLWSVENSADDIKYQGVDVHMDNPSEELNVVNLRNPGQFFGYPRCFTVWNMATNPEFGLTTGQQFSVDSSFNTSWCQSTSNVVSPVMNFQAHSAPLDIIWYEVPDDKSVAINTNWDSHAFVTFHGSWNRDSPTGYGIVHVPWDKGLPVAGSESTSGYEFIAQAPDLTKCPKSCFRPVALAFDPKGRLFGSSDSTGEIFVILPGSQPQTGGSVRIRVGTPAVGLLTVVGTMLL